MKQNKILITGGTGFIGYHLAKKCLKLNWSVDSISTNLPKKIRKLKKVKYIKLDISKKLKIKKKLLSNYDYVVNLAGYVDHSNKNKTLRSHFNGCKNIAEFFLNSKIKRFIQVGSCIEYGKIKSPQKENEVKFSKTYSYYGKAKSLSTKFLLSLHRKFNFPSTILRLYLVYGPKQDLNRIIPITIDNAIKNKEFDCSPGNQLRDFIYVDDLIEAIIKVLKNKNVSGQIINIGSGKPISIKKVVLKICKLTGGGNPKFGKIYFRNDEILKLYPDISKAKKLLKWQPKVSFNRGILKTIKVFKKLS